MSLALTVLTFAFAFVVGGVSPATTRRSARRVTTWSAAILLAGVALAATWPGHPDGAVVTGLLLRLCGSMGLLITALAVPRAFQGLGPRDAAGAGANGKRTMRVGRLVGRLDLAYGKTGVVAAAAAGTRTRPAPRWTSQRRPPQPSPTCPSTSHGSARRQTADQRRRPAPGSSPTTPDPPWRRSGVPRGMSASFHASFSRPARALLLLALASGRAAWGYAPASADLPARPRACNPAWCALARPTTAESTAIAAEADRLLARYADDSTTLGRRCHALGATMQRHATEVRMIDYMWRETDPDGQVVPVTGDAHPVELGPGTGTVHIARGFNALNPDRGLPAILQTARHEFAHLNGLRQSDGGVDLAAQLATACAPPPR